MSSATPLICQTPSIAPVSLFVNLKFSRGANNNEEQEDKVWPAGEKGRRPNNPLMSKLMQKCKTTNHVANRLCDLRPIIMTRISSFSKKCNFLFWLIGTFFCCNLLLVVGDTACHGHGHIWEMFFFSGGRELECQRN